MIKQVRSYQHNYTFWEKGPDLKFAPFCENDYPIININTQRTYQTHKGFGGAFSESAAINFAIAKSHQEEILDAYFSESGLNYNLGRAVIHSSDFSQKSRTYITDDDKTLRTFSIKDDFEHVIPFIKAAKKRVDNLWLLASAWSPPAFMKTNGDMFYGGNLKHEYIHSWAMYFVKYIQAMHDAGITIHAVTVQNEPEATQVWESCLVDSDMEFRLVEALHEAFKKADLDVKILIWDHNRDRVVERSDAILRKVPDKVWGVAYHWYVSEDSENLSMVHEMYPNHHILFTEGCVEFTDHPLNAVGNGKDKWKNAELYGRNIINDSLHYSEGFIEWNLLLNEIGGPNHVGNYCEAPIMYNRTTDTLIYNPSYYYIGHFSRFIKPSAKRVHVNMTKDSELFVTAYKNPNGDIAIVMQNEGWIKQRTLIVDGKRVEISLPKSSITTYIIESN